MPLIDLDLLGTDDCSKDKSRAMDHVTLLRSHISGQTTAEKLRVLRLECFGSIKTVSVYVWKKQSGAVRNTLTGPVSSCSPLFMDVLCPESIWSYQTLAFLTLSNRNVFGHRRGIDTFRTPATKMSLLLST